MDGDLDTTPNSWTPTAAAPPAAPSPVGLESWGPAPAFRAEAPAPWASPSPAPRHRRRAQVAAVLAIAGTSAGAAAAAGYVAAQRTTGGAAVVAVTTPSTPSPSTSPTPAPTAQAAAGGAVADVAAVTARVDPAIVDITVTLADGSGVAAGTGMVITSNGEILTNNHVIEGAGSISVQVNGSGPSYSATVLGYDVADDVALLRISGVSGLPTVSIGDSTTVSVGQAVVAIGNALGQGGTPAATTGSVSALSRTITASSGTGTASETLTGLIEVSAPIQPGDSGGALTDANGNVIGMNTAGQVTGRSGSGASTTAYAIPIATAMSIVQNIETGSASATITVGSRGVIGVQISASTVTTGTGVAVAGVAAGSPAESAGIVAGDSITSVGGTAVSTPAELGAAVQAHRVGDSVSVTWIDAAGAAHTAAVTLVAGPPA